MSIGRVVSLGWIFAVLGLSVVVAVAAVTREAFSQDDYGRVTAPVVHTQLECLEEGNSCLVVSGNYDRSAGCEDVVPKCHARHGLYGLYEIDKSGLTDGPLTNDMTLVSDVVKTHGLDRFTIGAMNILKSDHAVHAVWTLKPIDAVGYTTEEAMMVMHASRRLNAGDKQGWSVPDTLQRGKLLYAEHFDAVENSGDIFGILRTSQGRVHEGESYDTSLQLIRLSSEGRVEISEVPGYGGAYPQIETIGDSLHVVHMGSMIGNTPDLEAKHPQGHLGASVFLVSRHIESEDWEPTRLVYETGLGSAHFIETQVRDLELEVLFVEAVQEDRPPIRGRSSYRESIVHRVNMSGPVVKTEVFRSPKQLGLMCQPVHGLNHDAPLVFLDCGIGGTMMMVLADSLLRNQMVEASGKSYIMDSPTYHLHDGVPFLSFIEFKTDEYNHKTRIYSIPISP